MTPAELLAELERLNVKVTLAGDKLCFEAPAGVLSPELKETIAQHKQSLIEELQKREEEYRRRVIPFPYPINETLGIGDFDPLDVRYVDGRPVLEPGWWKEIPKEKGR